MDRNITIEEFVNIMAKEFAKNGCIKDLNEVPIKLSIPESGLTANNARETAHRIICELTEQEPETPKQREPELPQTQDAPMTVVEDLFQQAYKPKHLKEDHQDTPQEEMLSLFRELKILISSGHKYLSREIQKDVHGYKDICVLIELRSQMLSNVAKMCWLLDWMEENDQKAFRIYKDTAEALFAVASKLMDQMDESDLF